MPAETLLTAWDIIQKQWVLKNANGYEIPAAFMPSLAIIFEDMDELDEKFDTIKAKIRSNWSYQKFSKRIHGDLRKALSDKPIIGTSSKEGGFSFSLITALTTFASSVTATVLAFYKNSAATPASISALPIDKTSFVSNISQQVYTFFNSTLFNTSAIDQVLNLAYDTANNLIQTTNENNRNSQQAAVSILNKDTLSTSVVAAITSMTLGLILFYAVNREKKQRNLAELLSKLEKDLPKIKAEITAKEKSLACVFSFLTEPVNNADMARAPEDDEKS